MRARAVIGASYGDEGKGRTLDWLSTRHGSPSNGSTTHDPTALVVRSNGGAQAAHTVVRPDGARHVFHHIGSASFHSARTHLSRFMVSHPIVFGEEMAQLREHGTVPVVTADPRGFVTTPWDMMVNQAIEVARGGNRHGSCGLGFGETVGRCEAGDFPLSIADLNSPALANKLLAIREEWLPARLAELELAPKSGPLEFASSDMLIENFVDQCNAFARQVTPRADADIGDEEALIFEGAQGLSLDQKAAGFPFLTRSNTGMENIAAITAEAGIVEVDPVYVTRCYLTRHGRGPMEDERDIARWFTVDDPTNRPNLWQENLRFGLIDPQRLGERIRSDIDLAGYAGTASLAVTCLDQASGLYAWLEDGQVIEGEQARFIDTLNHATGLPIEVEFSSPVNTFSDNNMQTVFY